MSQRFPVFVFRAGHFARNGDSVVSAAPLDLVVSVFGGGGLKGEAGLKAVFRGVAFFRNDETLLQYLGVWGARKASRFRRMLREAGARLDIVREPPPARLVLYTTESKNSRRAVRTATPVQPVP
jgi:hypothetical protein